MTETPDRPADGALNPGELGANGKLRATWFRPDGTLGKAVDADDIDGAIVRFAEPVGSGLLLTLQMPDGTVGTVTYDPTVSAGGGTGNYGAAATYDAADRRLTLQILGTAPASFGRGDHVLFATPSNLDSSTDSLKIFVNDADEQDQTVADLDFDLVRPFDLKPSRAYEIVRRLVGARWLILEPLKLNQVLPIQRRTINVSNAQLKAIDDTPIELIPAPGAGEYIQILKLTTTHRGADRPTISGGFSGATPANISSRGNLLYGFITDDTHAGPFLFDGPTANGGTLISIVDARHFTGGLYSEDLTFATVYGRQTLVDGKAFNVVFGMQFTTGGSLDLWYTEAVFDELMATVNDNTMTIEVEYYIHD